jgi:cysteine-rich repeat protein
MTAKISIQWVAALFALALVSCTTKFKESDSESDTDMEQPETEGMDQVDDDAASDPAPDDGAADPLPDPVDTTDPEIEIPPGCGDGNLDDGEECDDGNDVNGDGCDMDCTFSCHDSTECDDGRICSGVETCDPETHACSEGTPPGSGTACEPDDYECTEDLCDGEGVCTHDVASAFCLIDGACLDTGDLNPDNECEACLPGSSQRAWSDNAGALCDDGDFCTTDDHCVTGRLCQGNAVPHLYNVLSVTTGGRHTCALLQSGTSRLVACWGDNDRGQLGNGTTTPSSAPVIVTGLPDLIDDVSAGTNHTCALMPLGGVKCWGSNEYGQLGIGLTVASRTTPADVTGFGSFQAVRISTGQYHTCAMSEPGMIKCWGKNDFGQLGNGADIPASPSLSPVDVSGIAGAHDLSAGGNHTCAVVDTDMIKCWGANGLGQLGDNTTTSRSTPDYVFADDTGETPFSGASEVSVGHAHTCARTTLYQIKCWGWNASGQLGDGSIIDKLFPVLVWDNVNGYALPNTRMLDAGGYHNCVVQYTTEAQCWGKNMDGQLGNNSSGAGTDQVYPGFVLTSSGEIMTGFWAISAGTVHTCAIMNTNELTCWGDNAHGQLGTGSTDDSVYPAQVVCGP